MDRGAWKAVTNRNTDNCVYNWNGDRKTVKFATTNAVKSMTSHEVINSNADIAIGNIVGSNIFNILFVVGTSALITPVVFESKFVVDSIVAVAVGMLLWIFSFRGNSLNRVEGILLLLGYLGYFIYLL